MSAVLPSSHAGDHAHDDHHHAPTGWRRWVFATNHKDIGTLYLLFSFSMLMVGGILALLLRAELFQPGLQLANPELFNQFTTMHGLIMVFGAIMPAFVGFANWMVPLQIGASDMAFARMNNLSFWLLVPAGLVLGTSFFWSGGAPASGWTLYAPLSLQMSASLDAAIFSLHIMGASSIMGAINIIVTILNMRAPGMTLMKMPMFCWGWLITAYLLVAVMPVFAGAITMTLTDRHFGTSFFNPAGGGDPVMYQHIFWFFGHPEVYIMILPAFGIISQVVPAFSRKKLFGYSSMVYAIAAIAILSMIVWAHHMFTVGMPVTGQLFFMYATMLISIPTAVKIFNWVATMWRGSMTFETPMLWAVGFIFVFAIGGFTGLIPAVAPIDTQIQDTYYIVAHFHYVLVAGSLFAMFAGFYYWIPKWSGVMYNETRGKIHFWWSMIAFNVTFFPMHFLGLAGMPRRYADYPMQFADFNMWASIGAFFFGFAQVYFFLFVVLPCMRGQGEKAPQRPWDGAEGLEWEVPSPAPFHTFENPPKLDATATRVIG
ncbi:cytochrome c oxidase subunit I [Ottowia sp.]|jgi:cytochrome c oxidase subunit 1|uniref:cytochrome c oxidase subunit I n=1 Tax=Ottowia sp. TaxID=1898956 RepID=UPI002BDA196A|nr:cytochrome c oxidase subunit I [Ottowia sp.]HRN76805.1 cytochrome c oxidase subunit I [Ottowia sp.]HRQ02638.1 cytochrome c oxidase subunit I [Ottowia sp.]